MYVSLESRAFVTVVFHTVFLTVLFLFCLFSVFVYLYSFCVLFVSL